MHSDTEYWHASAFISNVFQDESHGCEQVRGGGPAARYGHSSILYQTPQNSDYGGATLMIVFGGKDRNGEFLNDVWVMCVAGELHSFC